MVSSLPWENKSFKLFISMVPLLYNLERDGFPFLQHSPDFYGSPGLECFLACTTKMLLRPHWDLHTCPESGPTLRFGLMLCGHYPESLNNLIFEFVFSKQSLMRQQSMCVSRGHNAHTHTLRPVDTAGSVLKGEPGPALSSDSTVVVVAAVATARESDSLFMEAVPGQ